MTRTGKVAVGLGAAGIVALAVYFFRGTAAKLYRRVELAATPCRQQNNCAPGQPAASLRELGRYATLEDMLRASGAGLPAGSMGASACPGPTTVHLLLGPDASGKDSTLGVVMASGSACTVSYDVGDVLVAAEKFGVALPSARSA